MRIRKKPWAERELASNKTITGESGMKCLEMTILFT